MIRVLLVNEMKLIGNLMAAALEDEPDIQVVGRTTCVQEALRLAGQCDVVLLSTRLPDGGALEITQALAQAEPSTRILIIGVNETEGRILQYVEAGAAGYVGRDESVDAMLNRVRQIHAGKAHLAPHIASALISRVQELSEMFAAVESRVAETGDLTPRELEVLQLIGSGLTNQAIADQLVIELGTVKNHVHSILKKLEVNSRRDAAAHLALIRDSAQPGAP